MNPVRRLCRHCHARNVNRPRGLCFACYYRSGIKERYPSTSIFSRRGIEDRNGRVALPQPTRALPGTPEKVAVLEERAQRGLALFHPADGEREDRPMVASPRPLTLTVEEGDWHGD